MTRIVFCDVEGTLLRESFPAMVLREAVTMGKLSRRQRTEAATLSLLGGMVPGGAGRSLRMLGIVRSVAGSRVAEVDAVLDHVLPRVLDACKPKMVARLQEHQRQGYQVVLLSAGLQEGIVKLAAALSARGEGTHLQVRHGRYSGRVDGQVCQGPAKAARALDVLHELEADPLDCLGYGDTAGDIPFLSLLGQRAAVDPDRALQAYAEQHGWQVLITTSADGDSNAVVEEQARAALRRFVTPRRVPLRPREEEMLASGSPLVFGNGLHGSVWGSGPTVLLLHGWEGRGTSLMAFIRPLEAAGFRVVALDGPAHGASPGDTTDPIDFALHLTEVGRELGPLSGIVAHSMGAAATALAIRHDLRVDRVVLLAGPSSLPGVLQRYAQSVGLPDPVAERFYSLMALRVNAPPKEMQIAEVCRDFSVPALVFHDPEDAEVPFADALELAETWPGAELHVMHGSGHRRILFDPQVVEEAVAFLSGSRVQSDSIVHLPA